MKDECSPSDLVYHGSDWVSWFGLFPIAGRFSQIGLVMCRPKRINFYFILFLQANGIAGFCGLILFS